MQFACAWHYTAVRLATACFFLRYGLWTLEELFRGNGVICRTQRVIQGDDNDIVVTHASQAPQNLFVVPASSTVTN